ncbi:MAG: flagellar hook-length control protein FliK [Devosiaceae bacterium]|nr:flagellar hook-length control protein FliK [Devosiaceae bacterium MH13]
MSTAIEFLQPAPAPSNERSAPTSTRSRDGDDGFARAMQDEPAGAKQDSARSERSKKAAPSDSETQTGTATKEDTPPASESDAVQAAEATPNGQPETQSDALADATAEQQAPVAEVTAIDGDVETAALVEWIAETGAALDAEFTITGAADLPAPPEALTAPAGALARWFADATTDVAAPAGPAGPAQVASAQQVSVTPASGSAGTPAGTPLGSLAATPANLAANLSATGGGDQALQQPAGQQQPNAGLQPLSPDAQMPAAGSGQTFADAMNASGARQAINTASLADGDLASAQLMQATADGTNTQSAPAPTGPVTTGASQPTATAVPQSTTGQAVPMTALAVEITRQANQGRTQFDIRLDPPELGGVTVRLQVDAGGKARAHMVVERAETLEMLTVDAKSLERALQQAGLETEDGGLSFELASDKGADNGEQFAGTNDGSDEPSQAADADVADDDAEDLMTSPMAVENAIVQMIAYGYLDVRV